MKNLLLLGALMPALCMAQDHIPKTCNDQKFQQMEVKMLPQMPPFYGQNEEVRQLITLEPGERVQTLPAGADHGVLYSIKLPHSGANGLRRTCHGRLS